MTLCEACGREFNARRGVNCPRCGFKNSGTKDENAPYAGYAKEINDRRTLTFTDALVYLDAPELE